MSNKSPWVKASEREPAKEIGVYYFGKNKQGQKDMFSWDSMMQFFRPAYYEYGEMAEWLDESLLESPASEDYQKKYSEALEWIVMLQGSLTELVELKKLKDSEGKTIEYEERQPRAWRMAFKAVELLKRDDGFYNALQSLPSNAETVEKKEEENLSYQSFYERATLECLGNPNGTRMDIIYRAMHLLEESLRSQSPAVSAPVEETDYLLSTKANRERLEESINQERAKEYANEQGINYPIDITYQNMIKSQIQSAYLAGFTAAKDYAKGFYHFVTSLAPVGNYTDDQLIDLYDEHLNQQK
jgi:hypothetical protein